MAEESQEDDFESLFEGMVLVTPQFQPIDVEAVVNDADHPPPDSPLSPSLSRSLSRNSSRPLDESLFSDLTLQQQDDASPQHEHPPPPPPSIPGIRKKKRGGIRVGYARESSSSLRPDLDLVPPSDVSSPPKIENSEPIALDSATPVEIASREEREEIKVVASRSIPEDDAPLSLHALEEEQEARSSNSVEDASSEHDSCFDQDSLEAIKARILDSINEARVSGASAAAERKEAGRKRRNALRAVNEASSKYHELEKELEEACEREEFERADRVSQRLAVAEKEKQERLDALREAETECNVTDLKLQHILDLQITAEEDGISLLNQFSENAVISADSAIKDAQKLHAQDMEVWVYSKEALESKRMEIEIEAHLLEDRRTSFNDYISCLVADDAKEKEVLCQKREDLREELEKLLAMVRIKEAEIAECDLSIKVVDQRIAGAVSGFDEAKSEVDRKYGELQSALDRIRSESEALEDKRKEADEFLSQAEGRRSVVSTVATLAMEEANSHGEMLRLRRCLASSVLKSREEKIRLVEIEGKTFDDIGNLRLEISSARTSLQDLSSKKASIQQEVESSKVRISFIARRIPELEAKKKVAAAARNFKEAGRIAGESKAIHLEKETIQRKIENATLEISKVEEDIEHIVRKLQEVEVVIMSKEREAAIARCRRLKLVVAAALAEHAAALEMGDLDEATCLAEEAKDAESQATKLQQSFDFEEKELGKLDGKYISVEVISKLSGEQLIEFAASHISA